MRISKDITGTRAFPRGDAQHDRREAVRSGQAARGKTIEGGGEWLSAPATPPEVGIKPVEEKKI